MNVEKEMNYFPQHHTNYEFSAFQIRSKNNICRKGEGLHSSSFFSKSFVSNLDLVANNERKVKSENEKKIKNLILFIWRQEFF